MSQAGPVNILNGIDLKILKGEAIGLVGPSGSGKSTLLMVMSGLERPSSGKVTVAGHELSKFDEDAAARFRRGNVGIVFQSFHLIPTMTALENVAVPLELAQVTNAFDRAREELSAVGLAHRLDHYPSQLSGGEQQRVALARAIAPRPSLLFADEPTGNLDGRTGSEIMNLMFALQRERGATLILVTHDEDLVRRCDRIVRLRDGRIDGIETMEQSSAPIMVPSMPAGKFEPVVTVERPLSAAPAAEPMPAVEVSAAEPVAVAPLPEPLRPTEVEIPQAAEPEAAGVQPEPAPEPVVAEVTPFVAEVAGEAPSEQLPSMPPEIELATEAPHISGAAEATPHGEIAVPSAEMQADTEEATAIEVVAGDETAPEQELRRVAAGGE